ncbi:Non-catalytic module family EXPN protein [Ephemerocybe angulata]|uniref:Non-catalytic module family EXPN protein n=1 Tax=Ephemerocybe angulata TaxID=980116 RepID=A0A8H6ICT9_9AGAR|nr:Non-catalytic module family EXPN protein [Tulosesus angulatus]
MPHRAIALVVLIISLWAAPTFASVGRATIARAVSETSRYHKAHSLGDDYQFDPRDGWQVANVTNLQYKYRRDQNSASPFAAHRRATRSKASKAGRPDKEGIGGALKGLVTALKGLVGIGKPERVTITWYTGHDLKNPSCWSNGKWAPTDNSFVAALTQHGWHDKPKCFKFVELCNTPKRCVFVRVVDTCAGCTANSKHVDLTKAAFGELASFDEGKLNVQFRHATEPSEWHEDLWGPKARNRASRRV